MRHWMLLSACFACEILTAQSMLLSRILQDPPLAIEPSLSHYLNQSLLSSLSALPHQRIEWTDASPALLFPDEGLNGRDVLVPNGYLQCLKPSHVLISNHLRVFTEFPC